MLGRCQSVTTPVQDIDNREDSLNAAIANLEANLISKACEADRHKAKIDSLQALAPKLAYKYVQAKDRRADISRDSVKDVQIFDQVTDACDTLVANRNKIIAKYERRDSALLYAITIQHEQMFLKDSIIGIQAESLENKGKELESANKKVRRNRVIAGVCAIVAGVLVILH